MDPEQQEQQVANFKEALGPHIQDYESIDVRVVAIESDGKLICIGGRASLEDVPVKRIRKYSDLFESEVVLLHERLPVSELNRLLDQALSGEVVLCDKHVVLVDHENTTDGSIKFRPCSQVQFQDNRDVYHEDLSRWTALSVTWSSESVNTLLGYPARQRIERGLGAKGRGYKDLEDLFALFIPGHPSARGSDRIQFEVIAPRRIVVQPVFETDAVKVHVAVGHRIERSKLRFTAILYRSDFSNRKRVDRHVIEISPAAWKPTAQGYRATRVIPRGEGTSCEVLVVYGGQTIDTASGDTREGSGVASTRAWLEILGRKPIDARAVHPAWGHVVEGMEYPFAFLHVDIADHSTLLKRYRDHAKRAFATIENLFSFAMVSNGALGKWTGDGGVAFFIGDGKCDRVVTAALQLLLLNEVAHVSESGNMPRVELRIGVHVGESEWLTNTDAIHSEALNHAAHLQKQKSPPSGIAASADVVGNLRSDLAGPFRKVGRFEGHVVHLAHLKDLLVSPARSIRGR